MIGTKVVKEGIIEEFVLTCVMVDFVSLDQANLCPDNW